MFQPLEYCVLLRRGTCPERRKLHMAKKVTKIEPVRQNVIQTLRPKKRVCAYCRVSTDSTKQHTSYVAQVEYYESYIRKREDWEFVGIFADEAKS